MWVRRFLRDGVWTIKIWVSRQFLEGFILFSGQVCLWEVECGKNPAYVAFCLLSLQLVKSDQQSCYRMMMAFNVESWLWTLQKIFHECYFNNFIVDILGKYLFWAFAALQKSLQSVERQVAHPISLLFMKGNGWNLVSRHIFWSCLDMRNFSCPSFLLSELYYF